MIEESRRLLSLQDEDALAQQVARTAHHSLGYPAVAVALRDEDGAFQIRAHLGYAPKQAQVLEHCRLSIDAVASLRATWQPAGSIGYSEGNHVLWELGGILIAPLHDAAGKDIGLILLGKQRRLPNRSRRVVLELFAHAAATALQALLRRRVEEKRIHLIETQKRQLEALLQASASVHGTFDLDELLQRIAVSMTTCSGFLRAAVYRRDGDDMLHARAFVGVSAEDAERLCAPLPFAEFAHLMRPEMQISRSFLFDHTRHTAPAGLFDSLSVPEDREWVPGHWHPLDSLTIPLQNREGRTIGLISLDEPEDGLFPDLARIQVLELFANACAVAFEQARLYDEIQRLAMTDPLTGLHNRRALEDALRRELARGLRDGSGCSVLYCDLDGLKQLNDVYGHEVGDAVLQAVAGAFRSRLRAADLVARIGGDEFVVLLSDTNEEDAVVVADDVRALIAGLTPPAIPVDARLSISIGIAASTSVSRRSQVELLGTADRALYEAKAGGRNRVRVLLGGAEAGDTRRQVPPSIPA